MLILLLGLHSYPVCSAAQTQAAVEMPASKSKCGKTSGDLRISRL